MKKRKGIIASPTKSPVIAVFPCKERAARPAPGSAIVQVLPLKETQLTGIRARVSRELVPAVEASPRIGWTVRTALPPIRNAIRESGVALKVSLDEATRVLAKLVGQLANGECDFTLSAPSQMGELGRNQEAKIERFSKTLKDIIRTLTSEKVADRVAVARIFTVAEEHGVGVDAAAFLREAQILDKSAFIASRDPNVIARKMAKEMALPLGAVKAMLKVEPQTRRMIAIGFGIADVADLGINSLLGPNDESKSGREFAVEERYRGACLKLGVALLAMVGVETNVGALRSSWQTHRIHKDADPRREAECREAAKGTEYEWSR